MYFLKLLFTPITAPISFIQNNFKATLFVSFIIYTYMNTSTVNLQSPNLQEIRLSGEIIDANIVLEQINNAKLQDNIKGVLFVVDSPGGAVAPSIEIAYAIKELNELKPVIAYATGTMASGSYYASIYAKKIYSNPGSMIGSIGVIIQSIDASELLSKIGIKPQTVKVGTYKNAGTPTRTWNEQEKDELNKVIKGTYDLFVTSVAKARNLNVQDHKIYADAHIFTASQAKEVGLIDEVATITSAKQILKKEAKIENAIWKERDKMEMFMQKLITNTFSQVFTTTNVLLMAK